LTEHARGTDSPPPFAKRTADKVRGVVGSQAERDLCAEGLMKGYHDLIDYARREIYKIEG